MNVRLFAVARERAGQPSLTLDLPEGARVGDLKRLMAESHPALASLLPSLRIALNEEYVSDDEPIPPGADLAVIPPVSGG